MTQAFIHSYFLFPSVLDHVIDICKYVWVYLMETYIKPLEIISLKIAYWQALKKACPK